MGYQTVKSVPRTYTYEEALRIFLSIKPIRGRAPERRPLGNRRDCDTYWVRKNDNNDIEYMLYSTPVITFRPDDTVVVWMGGWNSVSTRQFITQVTGLPVCAQRGVAMISVGGEKYAFAGNDRLRLKWGRKDDYQTYENWSILSAPTHNGLHVNRKAANNVRERYKTFGNYLSGFLKVRRDEGGVIRISVRELGQAIGVTESEHPTYAILNKPYGNGGWFRTGVQVHKFIDLRNWRLIRSEPHSLAENMLHSAVLKDMQDMMLSNDHASFYKAAMLLCSCNTYHVLAYDEDGKNTFSETVSFVRMAYKNLLMKMHADEILERVELPVGAVPNQTYERWLTLLGKGEEA